MTNRSVLSSSWKNKVNARISRDILGNNGDGSITSPLLSVRLNISEK